MQNICVIGGSGFVGTRLISELINTHIILNLDIHQSSTYSTFTQIVDVRDYDSLVDKLKAQDLVILLAAEHKDDVSPISLYYDVNVDGMRNVLRAMDANDIKNIIFTSSVAIYGLSKNNPDEEHSADPFNHYGKSKWQAEQVLKEWYEISPGGKSVLVLRPTVIFGENNRGNVYNLLKQIESGYFIMIGNGKNKKSMAYVGNVTAFIENRIGNWQQGYHIYNYADKPDLSTNEIVDVIFKKMGKKKQMFKIPYWIGIFGGYCFDILAFILRRKLSISSIRVKKFNAATQYSADKIKLTGFVAPYSLKQAVVQTIQSEFIDKK